MRVLLALDGSNTAHKAVDFLVRHRAVFGQARELVCVFIEPPPPLRAVGAFGADPGMPAIAPVDTQAITDPLLARLRDAGYAPKLIEREGEPGPELAQLANDEHFDLVIIGGREHGLLRRAPLGSVGSKLLTGSTVPVLIVR